jgi:hypothetical protein
MRAAKKLKYVVDTSCVNDNRGLDERRYHELPQRSMPAEKHKVERSEARSHDAWRVTQAKRALVHVHVGRVDDEGLERGSGNHFPEANEAVPKLEVLQLRASSGAEEVLKAGAQRDPDEPQRGEAAEDSAADHASHLDMRAGGIVVANVERHGAVAREVAANPAVAVRFAPASVSVLGRLDDLHSERVETEGIVVLMRLFAKLLNLTHFSRSSSPWNSCRPMKRHGTPRQRCRHRRDRMLVCTSSLASMKERMAWSMHSDRSLSLSRFASSMVIQAWEIQEIQA